MDRLINNKIHITNRSNYVPKLSNMGQNLPKNGTVKVRKVLGENINFSAYPGQKRDKKSEKIGFLKTQIISNQIVGKIKNAAEYLALSASQKGNVKTLPFLLSKRRRRLVDKKYLDNIYNIIRHSAFNQFQNSCAESLQLVCSSSQ